MHLILLFAACSVGSAPDTSLPDDTDVVDTDVADTDIADTDADTDVSDTDVGAAAVECDDALLGGPITCWTLSSGGRLRQIDLGSGTVQDVQATDLGVAHGVHALFADETWFYAVQVNTISRFSRSGGDVETATGSWESVGSWNGKFVASGRGSGTLTTYADWEALVDALPEQEYGLTYIGERMAIHGDEAWMAWHSTDYLARYDLATMTRSGTAALEGYDTWVAGIARHDDWLLVLNDGRDDPPIEGHEPWEPRIGVFDTEGQALCSSWLSERDNYGLWCQP